MSNHCRIARIRSKSTGHEVRVLDSDAVGRRVFADLVAGIEYQVKHGWRRNIRGYALVMWDARGRFGSAMNCSEGPVARGRVPAFVAHAMANHATRDDARDDVMDELFQNGVPPDEPA